MTTVDRGGEVGCQCCRTGAVGKCSCSRTGAGARPVAAVRDGPPGEVADAFRVRDDDAASDCGRGNSHSAPTQAVGGEKTLADATVECDLEVAGGSCRG